MRLWNGFFGALGKGWVPGCDLGTANLKVGGDFAEVVGGGEGGGGAGDWAGASASG